MNWDITIGHLRQSYGRLLRAIGTRMEMRQIVQRGEHHEYAARLQIRYGVLKHQAQWHAAALRWTRDAVPVSVDANRPAMARPARRP